MVSIHFLPHKIRASIGLRSLRRMTGEYSICLRVWASDSSVLRVQSSAVLNAGTLWSRRSRQQRAQEAKPQCTIVHDKMKCTNIQAAGVRCDAQAGNDEPGRPDQETPLDPEEQRDFDDLDVGIVAEARIIRNNNALE
jgi:hypothetical protein